MFYPCIAVSKRLMMEEEKLCLDCGTPIKVGRKDKKFCDDTCRTNYNNNREKPAKAGIAAAETPEVSIPDFIKGINDALFNNRRILDEFLGSKDTDRIKKRDLNGRGFRFKFFTSCDDSSGENYWFCYDLGVKVGDNDWMIVVRRPREATY